MPDGSGRYEIIADPPGKLGSTSGEIHLSRPIAEGPRLHRIHLSIRARDRRNRYGGSDLIELGPNRVDVPIDAPEPLRAFGPQTRDRVRQQTYGIAYEGRWQGVGELSLGVQKSRYRKQTELPSLPPVIGRSSPWLFNIAAAATLSERFALYAGYTRGLEESGLATECDQPQ